MAYLFDTDALSEVMRKQPLQSYLTWLRRIPREEQFTSAVSIGELYQGAFRSPNRDQLLRRIDDVLQPRRTRLRLTAATHGLTTRPRGLHRRVALTLADRSCPRSTSGSCAGRARLAPRAEGR